jgi:DNA polymerase-3 subunit delta
MIIKNYAWLSPNNQHLQIQIQKHIDTIKNENDEIIKFDCKETPFSEIYEDMITPSLFLDAKIIILFHADVLYDDENDLLLLTQVLQRQSDDLILCLQMESLPEHPTLKKTLSLYVEILKSVQMNQQDMASFIQTNVISDGFSMDFSTQQFFIDRLKNQEESLYSYLNLLKTYTIDKKMISKEDILLMVPAPIEDNIFDIVTSYINGDIQQSIVLFEDLLIHQEDPLSILSMIGRKLIEIEDVKRLLSMGLDQRQIAEKLRISTGKAYYLMKESKMLHIKDVEKTIDDLNDLDYKIKSGRMDKTLGVYLFLIGGHHETSNNRHH